MMNNYRMSSTLLETSLVNSVEAFLNILLADLKIDYSNQRNMSAEQMSILKEHISAIIDDEIESVINTMNGHNVNNDMNQNNETLILNETKELSDQIKAIDNNWITRKDNSFLVKTEKSDEISELDLALVISEADFCDKSDIKKSSQNAKTANYNSTIANLASQIIKRLKIITPEMLTRNEKRYVSDGHKKQSQNNLNSLKIKNENLVNESEEKHLELALAISSADSHKVSKNDIKESQICKSFRELNNRYNDEKSFWNESSIESVLPKDGLLMKRQIKKKSMLNRIKGENLNIQKRIVESIKDLIYDYDLKAYTKHSMKEIKLWIDCYNALSIPRLSRDTIIESDDYLTANDISVVALELCSILQKTDKAFIKTVFCYIKPHIEEVMRICSKHNSMQLFDREKHIVDKSIDTLHPIFLQEFERVQIRGDGNCLWSSISVSMFSDYSFMESLRLLTAATLIQYKDYFERHINEQRIRFGYENGLTFEQLIDASLELSVWGDEYHLLALSLALHRPIISYGSFAQIPNLRPDMSYEELKVEYESENQINHMLYVGDSDERNNRPLCIYYNGENHYISILPKHRNVEPLIPKTRLFDYVIDREKQKFCRNGAIGLKNSDIGYKKSQNSADKSPKIKIEKREPLLDGYLVNQNTRLSTPKLSTNISMNLNNARRYEFRNLSVNEIQESKLNRKPFNAKLS